MRMIRSEEDRITERGGRGECGEWWRGIKEEK